MKKILKDNLLKGRNLMEDTDNKLDIALTINSDDEELKNIIEKRNELFNTLYKDKREMMIEDENNDKNDDKTDRDNDDDRHGDNDDIDEDDDDDNDENNENIRNEKEKKNADEGNKEEVGSEREIYK
ncbi:hypothetical protein Tco_1155032 [Tanacetum coccineum]